MIFPVCLCIPETYRSCSEGRSQPMMFLAIMTARCNFLISCENAAPNQMVRAEIRMLSIVAVQNCTSMAWSKQNTGSCSQLILLINGRLAVLCDYDPQKLNDITELIVKLLSSSEQWEYTSQCTSQFAFLWSNVSQVLICIWGMSIRTFFGAVITQRLAMNSNPNHKTFRHLGFGPS